MRKMVSLLLLAFTASCQKETMTRNCEGDNVQYIESFYADEFGSTPCSLRNISADNKAVNLVIKTQADYEKYFACSPQVPDINFEAYFILTGRYLHHQCAVFDNQQTLICDNKLIYRVRIHEKDCHATADIFYATVIEKKYDNLTVEFDVEMMQ